MLKNNFILFVLLSVTGEAFAQTDLIMRVDPIELMIGHVSPKAVASSVKFEAGTGALPSLQIHSLSAYLTDKSGISTQQGKVDIPLTAISVSASIDGGAAETANLSTEWVKIWTALVTLYGSKSVTFNFGIRDLHLYAWQAGLYTVDLELWTGNWGWGTSVTPKHLTLGIEIPKLLLINATPQTHDIKIDNFTYFRQQHPFTTNFPSIDIFKTVDVITFMESKNSIFDFTNGYNGVTPNPIPTDKLQTSDRSGSRIQFGTRPTPLPFNSSSGVRLPMDYTSYFIGPTDLERFFLNKGTYTTRSELSVVSLNPGDNMPTKRLPITVNLIVDDMAELRLNENQVNILYENYDGVSVVMNNHLVVSKTTPYDISVRATQENFLDAKGNGIPVSVLSIGPAQFEVGSNIRTISLSTTDQTLLSAATPVVDRAISLIYSIPSSKKDIMHEHAVPGQQYTNSLIYTLTGH